MCSETNTIKVQEITKNYPSYLFSKPIEVADIDWEIIVTITNRDESESVYSWYDLVEKESYSVYINKCILWWLIKWVPKKVLIIWFGWWSFIKFLEDHFQNIEITGIDIEPAMKNICEDILWVETNNLIIWDANLVLDELIKKNNKYDLILFDVYWNNSKIPENLTKLDFFEKIKKVLEENWIFSINMSDFEWEKEIYENIHKHLKYLFWNNFSLFQTWENDISNCMWIYNLEKNYSSKDFDENYKNLVKNNLAIDSSEITKNTFLDEEKKYLK